MPPEIQEIPRPKTMGQDALHWLEHHGVTARTPTVRSSDYESVLANPFSYYLHRRLGLMPRLRYSEALTRGGWFHSRLELMDSPPLEAKEKMNELLFERMDELKESCKILGIQAISRDSILETEEHDMLCACGWYEALMSVKIHNLDYTLHDWLTKPYWRRLGIEMTVWYQRDGLKHVAQFDQLLYHTGQNALWIWDAKTTTYNTLHRLMSCPIEFQTQHYLHAAKEMLPDLIAKFDLPSDVRIGGMAHTAVKKPTINLGQMDRDFETHEHELTRGPRKGEVEMRRVYSGEPRFQNYMERCQRWYQAEGEYLDKKEGREEDPVLNMSHTSGRILDDPIHENEYNNRLALITKYAKVTPEPGNFMKSSSLVHFGKLSDMADFYLHSPATWPATINDMQLMQSWRDENLPNSPRGMTYA